MLNNDLSNSVMPRILVVFENAIGYLPDGELNEFNRAARKKNWAKAADCWKLDDLMLRKLLDMTMRQGLNVEVVSFSEEALAAEFEEKLDDAGVPVKVWHSRPEVLARRLAYMPDVMVVYDADPHHVFTYGRKGRTLSNPFQLGG